MLRLPLQVRAVLILAETPISDFTALAFVRSNHVSHCCTNAMFVMPYDIGQFPAAGPRVGPNARRIINFKQVTFIAANGPRPDHL